MISVSGISDRDHTLDLRRDVAAFNKMRGEKGRIRVRLGTSPLAGGQIVVNRLGLAPTDADAERYEREFYPRALRS